MIEIYEWAGSMSKEVNQIASKILFLLNKKADLKQEIKRIEAIIAKLNP